MMTGQKARNVMSIRRCPKVRKGIWCDQDHCPCGRHANVDGSCPNNCAGCDSSHWDNVDAAEYKSYIKDLLIVGPRKPIGYLPLDTIEAGGYDVNDLIQKLASDGLQVLRTGGIVASGALYAWDRDALQKLLDRNLRTLEQAGWPVDVDSFVMHIIEQAISFRENPALYRVIGLAFNDERFQ